MTEKQKIKSAPWTRFAMKLDSKGMPGRNCLVFPPVTHISHTSDAIRIVEDGRIRTSLVYDESRLNTERVAVCWLSPKHWSDGYIYGHVSFSIDWPELIDDKQFYWIEHHQTKRQDICRLLISANSYPTIRLDDYPQDSLGGPVFRKNGTWYHNNSVTTEFLVDHDIPLRDVTHIRFVEHHPEWCAKHETTRACPDRKMQAETAGARFLAFVIGTCRQDLRCHFTRENTPTKLDYSVLKAIDRLERELSRSPSIGHNSVSDADWNNLLRASLVAIWKKMDDQRNAILALFPKEESVKTAFWRLINSYFQGISLDYD